MHFPIDQNLKMALKQLHRSLPTLTTITFVLSTWLSAYALSGYWATVATREPLYPVETYSSEGNNFVEEKLKESDQIDRLIAQALEPEEATSTSDLVAGNLSKLESDASRVPLKIFGFTLPSLFALKDLTTVDGCPNYSSSIVCNTYKYSYLLPVFLGLLSLWLALRSIRKKEPKKVKAILLTFMSIEFHGLVLVVATLWGASLFVIKTNVAARVEVDQISYILSAQKSLSDFPLYFDAGPIALVVASSDNKPPTIVDLETKIQLLEEFLQIFPTHTFVQKQILPYQNSAFADLSDFNLTQLLLPNNRLLINQFSKEDLQTLLPVLAPQIISYEYRAFEPNISHESKFQVLGSRNYQQFQELQHQLRTEAIADLVDDIRYELSRLENVANQAHEYVSDTILNLYELDQQYKEYVTDLESEYQKYCKETELEDRQECKDFLNVIDGNRQKIEENRQELESAKAQAEATETQASQYISLYEQDLKDMREYLALLEDTPVNTESEYGIFLSEGNQIYLKYEDGQVDYQAIVAEKFSPEEVAKAELVDSILRTFSARKTFAEYLNTAVHEYLHQTTFENQNTLWPVFLEEGMTELLAVSAMSKYVESPDQLGLIAYADQVKWIDTAELIMPKELRQLYFQDKSERSLAEVLETQLSEFNYDDFTRDGETLFYMGYDNVSARNDLSAKLIEMIR